MKLFIAILPPVELIEALHNVKKQNAHNIAGIRWIQPKNFHITLRYLGATSTLTLPKIIDHLSTIGNTTSPFAMVPKKISFSPGKKPNMYWCYFEKNNFYEKLCHRVSKEIVSDMPSRSNVIPHINIANFKKPSHYYPSSIDTELPAYSWQADRFYLLDGHQHNCYELPLAEIKLNG